MFSSGAKAKLLASVIAGEPTGCAKKIWSGDETTNKPESYIAGSSAACSELYDCTELAL